MKLVNDPVHGMVRVPEYAQAVVATPLFQRLGRVKQLGCLHLVWPSAVNTRLEHSIGTMHLAVEYARLLDMAPCDARVFVLASLLHDIGHGPFSHTFERAAGPVFDHDAFRFRLLAEAPDLVAAMDAHTREGIAAVWRGQATDQWPAAPVLHELLAGTAGVDRMDYLVRDSYHTTPQSRLDRTCVQAIMHHTAVDWRGGRVVYSAKGSQYVCNLLEGREYMYREVYMHPKARAADHLLIAAFGAGLMEAAQPLLTPDAFERVDDAWVTVRAWDGEGAYTTPLRDFLRGRLPALDSLTVIMCDMPSQGGGRVLCTRPDGTTQDLCAFWAQFRACRAGCIKGVDASFSV